MTSSLVPLIALLVAAPGGPGAVAAPTAPARGGAANDTERAIFPEDIARQK